MNTKQRGPAKEEDKGKLVQFIIYVRCAVMRQRV